MPAIGDTNVCDRCGSSPATIQDFCPECGPVPLCVACTELHKKEVADGDAL